MPFFSERFKIWNKGLIKDSIVCLIKLAETPVGSGVFLSARSFVASRISALVKFLLLNEKMFGF